MDRNQIIAMCARSFIEISSLIIDDDDEIETLVLEVCLTLRELHRRVGNGNPIPRVEGYVERIVPGFSAEEFKSHFRLLPETFEFILSQIHNKLVRHYDGKQMISPRKQLLLTIWRMATPDSYRSIIQRFGVGKATAIRAFRRVMRALTELAPRFIRWPTGDRVEEIKNVFFRASGFPGVLGALDGTHIRIRAPKEHPEAYVNRKKHYSIHLQAVCDHEGIYTHCYAGNVGSVHDARVFRLSSLSDFIKDDAKFPNDSHLLADAAYALHPRVLVPYPDNGRLDQRKRNFNFIHSSARMAIERSFALLKGRWRSLLDVLAMDRTDLVPYHIIACCVLHNICIFKNDRYLSLAVGDVDVNVNEFADGANNRDIAVAKRDIIAAELPIEAAINP